MTIQVQCGKCGKTYQIDEKYLGRKVKCKTCGTPIVIAAQAAPAARPSAGRASPSQPPRGATPKRPPAQDPAWAPHEDDLLAGLSAAAAQEEDAPNLPPASFSTPSGASRRTQSSTRQSASQPTLDEYEGAAPVAAAECPACGGAMTPGAILCMTCGYNTQTGSQMTTHVVAAPPVVLPTTPAAARKSAPTSQERRGASNFRTRLGRLRYTFMIFGIGGPLLPMVHVQFILLNIFGPVAPIAALVCGIVGALLFFADGDFALAAVSGGGSVASFAIAYSQGAVHM
jgi:hypothetical protein